MTGFKSKKTAALDEEGMYLVHQTASYADNLGKSIVALGKQTVKDIEQLKTQPAQEPVAYCYVQQGTSVDILTFDDEVKDAVEGTLFPLYAHSQRPWVGLTDEDLVFLFPHGKSVWVQEMVTIIQAKLKEKNNG